MSQDLIAVSRSGTEVGKFLESDLPLMIEQKRVLLADHYWKPGMAEWALVSQLIAERNEAARQAKAAADAEAARNKKEADEARRKLEAEEKEKARLAEAVLQAEVNARVERQTFSCHCCRHRFLKPKNPNDNFIGGVLLCFLGAALLFIPVFGPIIGSVVLIWASLTVLVSGLTPPHCPNCRSTNFSRKEGSKKRLFD
jgi:hypothetical protein